VADSKEVSFHRYFGRCMFCGKPRARPALEPPKSRLGPTQVRLHIYDAVDSQIVRGLNAVLKPFGTGVFHCGVEVYDLEWSFCDNTEDEEEEGDSSQVGASSSSGIFFSTPKTAEGHRYFQTIELGWTGWAEKEVFRLLQRLEKSWPGQKYDVLEKNCVHFCVALCKELGVQGPPDWTLSLASKALSIVTHVEDMSQAIQNRRRVAANSVGGFAGDCRACCGDGSNGAAVERMDVVYGSSRCTSGETSPETGVRDCFLPVLVQAQPIGGMLPALSSLTRPLVTLHL